HAANWNRDRLGGDPARFGETIDSWLAYCERLGIEGIAYGAVILRRRSGGATWVRADELPAERLRPASDHILRVFDAGDYLAGLTVEHAILGERLALAAGDRLEQRAVLENGSWVFAEVALRLEGGLGVTAALDPGTAELLASLDGRRTLAQVVDDLARRQKVSRESLRREAVAVVRGMLAAGFLVRTGFNST